MFTPSRAIPAIPALSEDTGSGIMKSWVTASRHIDLHICRKVSLLCIIAVDKHRRDQYESTETSSHPYHCRTPLDAPWTAAVPQQTNRPRPLHRCSGRITYQAAKEAALVEQIAECPIELRLHLRGWSLFLYVPFFAKFAD